MPGKLLAALLFAAAAVCAAPSAADAVAAGDPGYGPLKEQMSRFTGQKGATYAVYFEDLASGRHFDINGDKLMVAASTVKMPMALYVNNLVLQGKLHWHDRIAYHKATDYEDGSGVLRYEAREGDRYSLRVLTSLSVTISDNVAFRMLARHVGRPNFIAFMQELGGRTVYPGGKNLTTARDLAVYARAVLDFARRHPEEGKRLLDDLANPIFHVGLPEKLPDHVMVAHKEGDLDGIANDVGIVFCERPYIMVVLSSGIKDGRQGFADIAALSKMAYDYQQGLK
ncbi:serine hydrolase [Desulfotomaculum copahuensis]|nr:serine hydrolase [Desulfotomaculum copahuensis]